MTVAQDYMFRAISGYFVNLYFNTLYLAAKTYSTNSREGISVTDAYRAKVCSHIQAVKGNTNAFKSLFIKLHSYCVKLSSTFGTMSSSKFINTLVDGMVPVEYCESLSSTDKDEIFGVIILDLTSTLGAICTKPDFLRKIIDNHEKMRNVTCEMIFKESIRILENKKDMMLNKFISAISQSKDYVSSDTANKLRQQLDERDEIISTRNEEISDLRHQIEILKEKDIKLRRMVELLQKNRIVIHNTEAKPESIPLPSPKPPPPLTVSNLVEHTLQESKRDNISMRSNILGSVSKRPVPVEIEDSKSRDDVSNSSNSSSSSSSDDGDSKSSKNNVVNNIDGLLFTGEYSKQHEQ